MTPRPADYGTAFVTGAASGIGRAVALLLASHGVPVAAFDRNADGVATLVDDIVGRGGRCLGCVGDVRSTPDVEDAFRRGEAECGPIRFAVANAAVGEPCALEDLDDVRYARFIDINLGGTFRVCRVAGLRMRVAGGGSIVTVGSALAFMGRSDFAAYSAAKGGVISLTRALAAELAPTVRVNCVCPGLTDTPMTTLQFAEAEEPEDERRSATNRIPLARLGSPEEIASAIVWLGGEGAAYATGSVVMMDGGVSAI